MRDFVSCFLPPGWHFMGRPATCLTCASHSPPHQCTYAHGRGQLPFASSSGHSSTLHASAMGADRSSTISNETKLWKSNLKQLQTTNSPSWTPQNLERALLALKTIRTRDPHGLLIELSKGIMPVKLSKLVFSVE